MVVVVGGGKGGKGGKGEGGSGGGVGESNKGEIIITVEIQSLKRREVRKSPCKRRASGGADFVPCSV